MFLSSILGSQSLGLSLPLPHQSIPLSNQAKVSSRLIPALDILFGNLAEESSIPNLVPQAGQIVGFLVGVFNLLNPQIGHMYAILIL